MSAWHDITRVADYKESCTENEKKRLSFVKQRKKFPLKQKF